jgi:hypothetical protein
VPARFLRTRIRPTPRASSSVPDVRRRPLPTARPKNSIRSFVRQLRQRVYLGEHCIEEWDFDFGFVIPGSVNTWQTTIESAGEGAMLDPTQISGLGAFYTLVPIRPRSRCERRSLRTLPGASLRPSLAFNPRPRRLSTPTDAFELHPDIRSYGTALSVHRDEFFGRRRRLQQERRSRVL